MKIFPFLLAVLALAGAHAQTVTAEENLTGNPVTVTDTETEAAAVTAPAARDTTDKALIKETRTGRADAVEPASEVSSGTRRKAAPAEPVLDESLKSGAHGE